MDLPDSRNKVDRVSNLRHDIMNPLTVILGYVKMLTARSDLPPDAARYVSRIQDEARRCIEIFDEDKARHDGAFMAAAADRAGTDSSAGKSVSVLVVDDDRGIRSLSCEVIEWGLKDSGRYEDVTVLCAEDADSATTIVRKACQNAIVMDLNLGRPGGGIDLVNDLEKLSPGVSKRTVFVSGGILDLATETRLDAMDIAILHKPFSIHDLVRMVLHAVSR